MGSNKGSDNEMTWDPVRTFEGSCFGEAQNTHSTSKLAPCFTSLTTTISSYSVLTNHCSYSTFCCIYFCCSCRPYIYEDGCMLCMLVRMELSCGERRQINC